MIARRRLLSALAAGGLGLTSAGCISVFPKSKEAVLYRFGAAAPPSRLAPTGPRAGVLKLGATFPRASGGDRILGITGSHAAFLAETRWMAPAATLFDEAVAQAFDGGDGVARLITRGEAGRADFALRLDMRNFEAVYLDGDKAAPTVLVRLRAVMLRSSDRTLAGETLLEARVKAGENRISAIVAAFNEAVGKVITDLVAWTDETAAKG